MPRLESRTLQTVTLADITSMTIYRSPKYPSGLAVSVSYGIRDEFGNVVYQHSIGDLAVSDPARSSIATWLTNNALPVINTEEGL